MTLTQWQPRFLYCSLHLRVSTRCMIIRQIIYWWCAAQQPASENSLINSSFWDWTKPHAPHHMSYAREHLFWMLVNFSGFVGDRHLNWHQQQNQAVVCGTKRRREQEMGDNNRLSYCPMLACQPAMQMWDRVLQDPQKSGLTFPMVLRCDRCPACNTVRPPQLANACSASEIGGTSIFLRFAAFRSFCLLLPLKSGLE